MLHHHRDPCSTMLTAALVTIARDWKQPRYLSTEERIKKTWYIYTAIQNKSITKPADMDGSTKHPKGVTKPDRHEWYVLIYNRGGTGHRGEGDVIRM